MAHCITCIHFSKTGNNYCPVFGGIIAPGDTYIIAPGGQTVRCGNHTTTPPPKKGSILKQLVKKK